MNLAIEYLTRTKLSQQLLKTPCSLFLNNVFDKNPLVVTIQNCYGKPQEVVVKHWQLGKVAPDRVLPPVEEFVVNREDMFTSPFVVLDDYNIMDYAVSRILSKQNKVPTTREVVVKHWQLGKVAPDRVLPPVEEFVVNREDMFTSPFVVLDDYNIMDYAVSPYPVQAKQSADEPYATTQEKI
jgi:hypothetical protein